MTSSEGAKSFPGTSMTLLSMPRPITMSHVSRTPPFTRSHRNMPPRGTDHSHRPLRCREAF